MFHIENSAFSLEKFCFKVQKYKKNGINRYKD